MAKLIEDPLDHRPKMMTLVFLDLESTGLPTPGNYPRITELSMIAIDTVSLTTCQDKPPRVRNKLTLCMYPMRTVSLGAFRITGKLVEQEGVWRRVDDNLALYRALRVHQVLMLVDLHKDIE